MQVEEEKYNLTAGVFYFHENSPAVDVLGVVQPIQNGVVVVDPTLDFIFGSGTTRTRSRNDSIAGYAPGT